MDQRFDRGIVLFNQQAFFDAHEVWEDLWHEYRDVDRTFLQGLIQLAAGCYHAQCGNSKGALSQLNKGFQKLLPYGPGYRRIDLLRLRKTGEGLVSTLEHGEVVPADQYPTIERNDLLSSS